MSTVQPDSAFQPVVIAAHNPALSAPAGAATFWQAMISAFPLPAFVRDGSHRLVAVSQTFCELFGRPRQELIGLDNVQLDDDSKLLNLQRERHVLQTCQRVSYDVSFRAVGIPSDQRLQTLRVRQSFVLDTEGNPFLLGTVEDLTQAQHRVASADRQTERASAVDPLTGLANRNQLQARLVQEIRRRETDPGNVSGLTVLLVNVNDFGAVNDSVGVAAGDEVIRVWADRIRNVVPGASEVARVGGDEFLVMLTNGDESRAETVAEEIIQLTQCPIEVCGTRRELSCSVGVASFPKDGTTACQLLRMSNHAMLQAKKFKPEGKVQIYQPSIGLSVDRRLRLEQDLIRAVNNDQIELHFQPIVKYLDGQSHVLGYEALSRWNRPDGQPVRPDEFIPVLESSGLIVQAGENILRRACQFNNGIGPSSTYVSVNISGRQLIDPKFLQRVDRIVAETGVDYRRLAFELTETAAMSDDPAELKLLNELVRRGIRLMIDDFGTGYSNLSRLRRLPFDVLKIDRGLIRDVPASRSDSAIVETLVRMATEMKMDLIVEGVEQPAQRDYLIQLGVNTFQGYLFGKPKPMLAVA